MAHPSSLRQMLRPSRCLRAPDARAALIKICNSQRCNFHKMMCLRSLTPASTHIRRRDGLRVYLLEFSRIYFSFFSFISVVFEFWLLLMRMCCTRVRRVFLRLYYRSTYTSLTRIFFRPPSMPATSDMTKIFFYYFLFLSLSLFRMRRRRM